MPIFTLDKKIKFPPVELADETGILAVGGDLSSARLIEAYRNGIFPWYSDEDPIIWWSPNPRFVLFPEELYVSKTMRQVLRRGIFSITCDHDFRGVIQGCREPRKKERGTWITDDMLEAYVRLHELGIAHSVEAWMDEELSGGLYGIALGRCFFGESMFARQANASKAAFIVLVRRLAELGFTIVDCQVYTAHLESLGARHIPREDYIAIIREGVKSGEEPGSWKELL